MAIVGVMIIFYVFDRYTRSTFRIHQQELSITRLEMKEKHYAQIELVNREHASFLHDVHHYMKIIGEIAAENGDEEIVNILSDLKIKITATQKDVFCNNWLVNVVLNEKKSEAEKKKICMKIKIENNFAPNQIEDIDMIAIMGNLLDNAMEAAEKCEEGYIEVYMFNQEDNDFSIIKIINNYVGEIKKKEDRFFTNKKDKVHHGYGIQNVDSIATKYGGYLQNHYENGVFTAIVLLANPCK